MQSIRGSFVNVSSSNPAFPASVNTIPVMTSYSSTSLLGGKIDVLQSTEYPGFPSWKCVTTGSDNPAQDGTATNQVSGTNPWTYTVTYEIPIFPTAIIFRGRSSLECPKQGRFEGSQDGVNWEGLVKGGITDAAQNLGNKTYTVDATKTYNQIRFTNELSAGTNPGVGYIQILGTLQPKLPLQFSDIAVIQSNQTSLRLSIFGLDANNQVKTQKSLDNGITWVDQVTYNVNQVRTLISVVHGEQWRLATVQGQAFKVVEYILSMES